MTKNTDLSRPNAIELESLKIHFDEENYEMLEEKVKPLIQKYPNVPMLYNILGVSQSSRGIFDKATANFEKAINLDPKFMDAHNNLGIAYKNCGKFKKSFAAFQNALKINPNYHLSNYGLGDLYTQFNEIDKAIDSFKKAIDSRPDFALAYSNYLFFLNYLEKYDSKFYYESSLNYSKSVKRLEANLLSPFKYNKFEVDIYNDKFPISILNIHKFMNMTCDIYIDKIWKFNDKYICKWKVKNIYVH